MKFPRLYAPVTASCLAYAYLQLVGRTNRVEFAGRNIYEELRQGKGPYIFAFWHHRLLLPLYIFRGMNVATMVSQSRDGEYIAQVMLRCGLKVSRGSASRRGAEGLLGLMRLLRQGTSAAITPDGPRGPCEIAQSGIIQLAKLSGIPITPVSFGCTRYKRMKSWDRMVVPLPFGKIRCVLGKEIAVERQASKEELEQKRAALEEEMRRITEIAEAVACEPFHQ